MTPEQVEICLRVDREIALQRFLHDCFVPILSGQGYNLRNLLQALGGLAFEQNSSVAHHLWDAVAELDFANR